jgi:hypothetical protein
VGAALIELSDEEFDELVASSDLELLWWCWPIVAWGDLNRIGDRVRETFAAGADQVVLNIVAADESAAPLAELRRLSP